MTGPRLGQGMPADSGWFARQIADLQRQINELRAGTPNALTSPNFNGTVNPAVAGTLGWALDMLGNAVFSGDTTIGGDLVVDGTLSLPNGIVGDAALATSPLVPQFAYTTANNYTIPQGTGTVKATSTIPIPSGYSQALTLAIASDYGHNSTAGTDWLNSQVKITAGGGSTFATGSSPNAAAGEFTSSFAAMVNLSSALSGGNVVITSSPLTSVGAWSTNSLNQTAIIAICLFLR